MTGATMECITAAMVYCCMVTAVENPARPCVRRRIPDSTTQYEGENKPICASVKSILTLQSLPFEAFANAKEIFGRTTLLYAINVSLKTMFAPSK